MITPNQIDRYEAPPRLQFVEQSLIGKLLEKETDEILSRVYQTDFYHDKNQQLYEAIKGHYVNYGSISASVIYDKSEMLGYYNISDLKRFQIQAEPEDTNALILELKDYLTRRDQHEIVRQAITDIYNPKLTSKEIHAKLTQGVTSLSVDMEVTAFNMTEIKEKIETENLGASLKVIDQELIDFYGRVGLHTYQTEVHVARSKHGKTTYACYKTAQMINSGHKGVFFTLEGSKFDIYESLMNQIQPEFFENLLIIDNANSSNEISAKIYELKIKYGIDFAVVDYIQRVQSEGVAFSDETPRVAKASMELTNSAIQNGIYMLMLAQPRKALPDAKGWKLFPSIDDIYGSGQIVKDAYCVTAGFRPLIAGGMLYKHGHLDRDGVMGYNGNIFPKHSYFVRMLLCRKGEMSNQTLHFTQQETTLQLKNNIGDRADEYVKLN